MHVLLLAKLREHKQGAVAASMGVGESKLSTLKNDQLPMFCALLAALDLKLVGKDEEVRTREDLQLLEGLARKGSQLWLGEGNP